MACPEADGKAESQRCKKKEKALSSVSTHSGSPTRSALYAAEETIPANGIDHANLKKNPGPTDEGPYTWHVRRRGLDPPRSVRPGDVPNIRPRCLEVFLSGRRTGWRRRERMTGSPFTWPKGW